MGRETATQSLCARTQDTHAHGHTSLHGRRPAAFQPGHPHTCKHSLTLSHTSLHGRMQTLSHTLSHKLTSLSHTLTQAYKSLTHSHTSLQVSHTLSHKLTSLSHSHTQAYMVVGRLVAGDAAGIIIALTCLSALTGFPPSCSSLHSRVMHALCMCVRRSTGGCCSTSASCDGLTPLLPRPMSMYSSSVAAGAGGVYLRRGARRGLGHGMHCSHQFL
jgi:hypothetical protein